MVKATFRDILKLDVREEEPVEDKVAKLGLIVIGYKEKIGVVQFKYEM